MFNALIYLLGALCLVIPVCIIIRLIKRYNRAEAVRVAREHRVRIMATYEYGYQHALNDFDYMMKLVNEYDIKPEEIGAKSYQNIARVASSSFEKHLEFVTKTKQGLYSEDELRSLWHDLSGLRIAWSVR